MKSEGQRDRASGLDNWLGRRGNRRRVVDGLQHGYVGFCLSCELIGGGHRRLILRAGKNCES